MWTIREEDNAVGTSRLKYLRRACITHRLWKGGGEGIIKLWIHNRKQKTNTGNDKPCSETTVRMTVVRQCILVYYFFNRGLHFKVVIFFRYQTAVVRNSYIFDGDILIWVLQVVGMPNHWKTTVVGEKDGKNAPCRGLSCGLIKNGLYFKLIAFKSWCARTAWWHQCRKSFTYSLHLPMGGKSKSVPCAGRKSTPSEIRAFASWDMCTRINEEL